MIYEPNKGMENSIINSSDPAASDVSDGSVEYYDFNWGKPVKPCKVEYARPPYTCETSCGCPEKEPPECCGGCCECENKPQNKCNCNKCDNELANWYGCKCRCNRCKNNIGNMGKKPSDCCMQSPQIPPKPCLPSKPCMPKIPPKPAKTKCDCAYGSYNRGKAKYYDKLKDSSRETNMRKMNSFSKNTPKQVDENEYPIILED